MGNKTLNDISMCVCVCVGSVGLRVGCGFKCMFLAYRVTILIINSCNETYYNPFYFHLF